MRYLAVLLALCVGVSALAADYAREKKWADEILPAVLVGDPVWIEGLKGHKFLGLYTPAAKANAKAAVIVVHGIGVHPDWGLISNLRQHLPDHGYSTLSIQMPVLAADARGDAYTPTFPDAAERLKRAVAWLKEKGYKKVAIVSHSLGSRMTYVYLNGAGGKEVAAWVSIGSPGAEDWSRLRLPVLDLHGEHDLPTVLQNASKRAKALKHPKSAQIRAAGADHFFEGQDAALLQYVRDYLDKTL